ncbi:MAG: RnfABCDGE type electron transport complex subunit D [Lachnospiraceae bacterium]
MMEKTYLNPHIRTPKTTERIMKDVCLALGPAFIGAVYFFGVGAFFLTLACVATCVACEALWEKLNHLPVRMDYSAVVTGMLLAFNLSSNTPVWVAILASAFAIIVVKQCFGGIRNEICQSGSDGPSVCHGGVSLQAHELCGSRPGCGFLGNGAYHGQTRRGGYLFCF